MDLLPPYKSKTKSLSKAQGVQIGAQILELTSPELAQVVEKWESVSPEIRQLILATLNANSQQPHG